MQTTVPVQADCTTVVALVDHLERKKVVKRARSTDDRRAYTVTLTAKGRELAKRAIDTTAELERRLSTRLLAAPGPIASAHGSDGAER